MKFDIKIDSKIDIKSIFKMASNVWKKIHTLLFFVALLIAIAFGGYIWKQNVYSGEWSNAKKQEYINSQNKEIIFKEADFKKVTNDIQARKNASENPYQPIKDIIKEY